MPYAEKKAFIQSLVDKVIYSQDKLIFYLVPDITKLQPFVTENFINQKSELMEFAISDSRIVITVPIVLRKYVNTIFDKTKNGVLSITDNNHLILKAFATAWRYREMYEKGNGIDEISKMKNTSVRNVLKYLDLAFTSPSIVNDILAAKYTTSITELFVMARKHQL